MTIAVRAALAGGLLASAIAAGPTWAEPAAGSRVEAIRKSILSEAPQTKASPDHDRITARRIDIVDENGTIRLSLSAPTPAPIIGGMQYKRAFPVSGMVIFDAEGNERGGIGVADIPGSATVLALDHENMDAIGWKVMPDGGVSFQMNEKPPVTREPALENRVMPGAASASRILMTVAGDGTPAIALADKQDRPRLRLTVTKEGFGAIEFLDAEGKVVDTFAPEARRGK